MNVDVHKPIIIQLHAQACMLKAFKHGRTVISLSPIERLIVMTSRHDLNLYKVYLCIVNDMSESQLYY